jgi:hypothetical protein
MNPLAGNHQTQQGTSQQQSSVIHQEKTHQALTAYVLFAIFENPDFCEYKIPQGRTLGGKDG